MSRIKIDLDKAVSDGLITAKNAKTLGEMYRGDRSSSRFINFMRDLGLVLMASGTLTLLYTFAERLSTPGQSLMMVAYIILAGLLFNRWHRQSKAPQLAAAVGLVIPAAMMALLSPLLAPGNLSDNMPATWHIVTLASLLSAGYIAYKHPHWLTHVGLAGFWSLFILSLTHDLGHSLGLAQLVIVIASALATTAAAFAWRLWVKGSRAESTTWLHVASSFFAFAALLPSIYENTWAIPGSIVLLLLGALLRRGSYGIVGGALLLMLIVDRLSHWINGPFAAATLVIALGVLLLSASYKSWAEKVRFKRLPAWVARN